MKYLQETNEIIEEELRNIYNKPMKSLKETREMSQGNSSYISGKFIIYVKVTHQISRKPN